LYCYSVKSITGEQIHTVNCPHYQDMGGSTGICDLADVAIIDQVKECGLRYDFTLDKIFT